MSGDKKIIVAFYSKTGNTERVARDIAARLGADAEKIVDKKKRSGLTGYILSGRDAMRKRLTEIEPARRDPADYDLVILGTPVWGWNATPAITTYIASNRDKIRNAAFFVTSGSTEAKMIAPYLEKILGQRLPVYTGFNRRELADPAVYGQKLEGFIDLIRKQSRKTSDSTV